MLNGPNGPVGNFSLIEVAELQFGYIMQLVEQLRSGEYREVSATAGRAGRVRGGAGRGGQEDDLGHRLPELVPRRPRHPRGVAVDVRPLPRRDERTRPGRLRVSVGTPWPSPRTSRSPTRAGSSRSSPARTAASGSRPPGASPPPARRWSSRCATRPRARRRSPTSAGPIPRRGVTAESLDLSSLASVNGLRRRR